jgi:hypothetical protein
MRLMAYGAMSAEKHWMIICSDLTRSSFSISFINEKYTVCWEWSY